MMTSQRTALITQAFNSFGLIHITAMYVLSRACALHKRLNRSRFCCRRADTWDVRNIALGIGDHDPTTAKRGRREKLMPTVAVIKLYRQGRIYH